MAVFLLAGYYFSSRPSIDSAVITTKKVSQTGKLNRFSIRQLKMVGFLKRDDQQGQSIHWGLIKTPDDQVTPVHIDDRIGQEKAQVIGIEPAFIKLALEKASDPILIHSSKSTS